MVKSDFRNWLRTSVGWIRGLSLLRLTNTLGHKVEEIQTVEPGVVRMYTCGPTVYRYAHIGNLRSYLMADWIRRVLERHGYEVAHVKNITDVGHMRQEALEQGGDRVILAALEEGKTPQEIARHYADAFSHDEERLNIRPASHLPWATDHVPEMLDIVRRLVDRGYAYEAAGNVYFDVARFEDYGKLSGNRGEGLAEGVRVEADPHKRDPRDFTLWKLAEPGREMKWPSPWGDGFPGWHIECSAMATKYLGPRLDIHTGGVDNIFPHHEGEIAQSEAAFDDQYVRHWVHGQHLLVDGVKMAKSSGNVFILDDLVDRAFDPLSFRYLCMTVNYRNRMNFTLSALRAAEKALTSLRDRMALWDTDASANGPASGEASDWNGKFWDRLDDDLDLPGGLAVLWGMAKSSLPSRSKLELLREWDTVLGLDLDRATSESAASPIAGELARREDLRHKESYQVADAIRTEMSNGGYLVRDTFAGPWTRPKTAFEQLLPPFETVSSPREVESYLDRASEVDFTMVMVVSDYLEDVKRCANSALKWAAGHSAELVVVDNGSTDGTAEWLESLREEDARVRVVHCDHVIGEAAAKNIGLKQSLGDTIVIIDPSVETTGDALAALGCALDMSGVGMVGPWGLLTENLQHFHEEVTSGEADAMQAYCQAFPRELVREAGLMREGFRFYRNLDLDFSFQVRDRGHRIVAIENVPMVRHEHRQWAALDEGQRNELSFKNFKRFYERWGHRADLVVSNRA